MSRAAGSAIMKGRTFVLLLLFNLIKKHIFENQQRRPRLTSLRRIAFIRCTFMQLSSDFTINFTDLRKAFSKIPLLKIEVF
jgi:hypothetical protein